MTVETLMLFLTHKTYCTREVIYVNHLFLYNVGRSTMFLFQIKFYFLTHILTSQFGTNDKLEI